MSRSSGSRSSGSRSSDSRSSGSRSSDSRSSGSRSSDSRSSGSRSSDSRSSGSRSSSQIYQKSSVNNIPPPKQIPPAQIPPSKSQESVGFMSSVMSGFGFGLGSSIALRTIGGIFGYGSNHNNSNSNNNKISTQSDIKITDTQIIDYTNPNYQPSLSCELLHKEFIDCMRETNSNTHCSISYQIYKDCEDRYKSIRLDK
jgi:hypothetical protein